MIFYFGLVFCLAGLGMFFVLVRKMRRPKAEATIQEISLEYHRKDKRRTRKHPHAVIAYTYDGVNYATKIFLLKRHLQIGDNLIVSFKEESPATPTMYAPKHEIFAVASLMSIGLALIGLCVFVMDYFELW